MFFKIWEYIRKGLRFIFDGFFYAGATITQKVCFWLMVPYTTYSILVMDKRLAFILAAVFVIGIPTLNALSDIHISKKEYERWMQLEKEHAAEEARREHIDKAYPRLDQLPSSEAPDSVHIALANYAAFGKY